MSQYVISFDPELNIDVQQFVNAWNQHTAASQLAHAEMPDARDRDLAAGSRVVALLGGIAIGVATNAIYDVIKEQWFGQFCNQLKSKFLYSLKELKS